MDMNNARNNGHIEYDASRLFDRLSEHPDLAAHFRDYEGVRVSWFMLDKPIPPEMSDLWDSIENAIDDTNMHSGASWEMVCICAQRMLRLAAQHKGEKGELE